MFSHARHTNTLPIVCHLYYAPISMTSSDGAIVVSAVISMGKSLKHRVFAEGVETLEQLAFLQAHGCDEGQGYYFSPPVDAQQFAKLLQTGISATVLN